MNIFKVIAVNILSLIDIVFLLISTILNIISRLVSRSFILLAGFLVIIALGVAQSLGFDHWLLLVIIYTIIFGIFGLAVVYAGAIVMAVAVACAGIFSLIAGFVQGISEGLLEKCDNMMSDSSVPKKSCPVYSLAKLLKTIIDMAAGLVPALGVLAAVGVVVLTPVFLNMKVKSAFGVGLFSYLGLFPKGEAVFAVIYGILAIGTVAVTLISLGVDLGDSIEDEGAKTEIA